MTTETLILPSPPRTRAARPGTRVPDTFIREFGPNWFASVMGTGIVATAAFLLPVRVPALHMAATGVWILAATMLVMLSLAGVAHAVRHPDLARSHHLNPAMAPFYGAPPMALLTVGAGALLAGRSVIGPDARATSAMALLYGVPIWGFAILWLTIAAAITVRTARRQPPFSLTWWSFTFPVGTVATATSELALRTGADAFKVAAIGLYGFLVLAWVTAAVRTARGTVTGSLYTAVAPEPAIRAAAADIEPLAA